MKHLSSNKSICTLLLSFLLILQIIAPISAKSFGIIGSVLSTDIKAYINGTGIPAYNVDGNMVIIGSDLRNYGFDVVYNNDTRTSAVTYTGTNGTWTPIPVPENAAASIGEKVMDVYDTDITVTVNGVKIQSYNVDGKMAFKFSELKVYGAYQYDNSTRSTSLYLNGAVPAQTITTDGIRPEFKEAMDAYEAFYIEYCDFMKQFNENPTDLTLFAKYGDMLVKVAEMNEAFEAWDEDELNNEELKYYLDVNNNVMKMLIDVAG